MRLQNFSNRPRTRWQGGDANLWLKMWLWTASGNWAGGASRWKKNARSDRRDRETAGARYGRRSHQWSAMDSPDDRQACRATAPAAHSGEPPYPRPIAAP